MVVPRNLNDSTAATMLSMMELDRGSGEVICLEREKQWGEKTALRSSSADGVGIGCEFTQPHSLLPVCQVAGDPLTDGGPWFVQMLEDVLDPIPSAMLQTISPDLLPFITTVINGSLTSGHVPTAFKKARVIPILKKSALDPSDISNYRPNNLLDPNQSGFKAAHSTETALLAVTEKLHAARSAKLSSVLILLDLSAAFDTVNHKTLLSTLRSLGICGTAWEWFASYLDGRSYQISACLADISSWMTAHQLKLNPSKTELLIIPGDPSPAQDLTISLSNSMISPTASARNLGVTMDNQLSFSSHVTNVTRSCRFLLYNIRRIRPFLSTQATQVLVQSLVIWRLDYCNSLLAGLPLNAIRPLQMIQNAAPRLVFNLPKFSHTTPLLRSLHWLPVAARIRFKTLMLAYKAKNGPAPSYLKALITSRTAPRLLRSTSTARLVPPSLREKGFVPTSVVFGLAKLFEFCTKPRIIGRLYGKVTEKEQLGRWSETP
ncbi:hypothetical protein QTP70_002044 [Hemibagrus guttatus]|uniref:Reverse transcriptase domain-containing protein n=1 Tax=Hemibagrus guttatus TaxID=175788 RepID=A0AAE0QXB2_9TELE|nr:hypothetical protein QTP70_002044 [Hemibagrus guttatus]